MHTRTSARVVTKWTASALLALVAVALPSAAPQRREFPDTSNRIAIFADQLPAMSGEALRFAATHYVGTQKMSLDMTRALRRVNRNFLVLHYKLAMWQSRVNYIIDGSRWGNDFSEVNKHESWFWHNPDGQRVASNQDRKLLMNVANPEFRTYWKNVLAAQVDAGEYDGVFFDSASPSLLQWEARLPPDPRFAGRGARDFAFPEFGGRSWIAAWEDWMTDLDTFMSRRGTPLIPNVGALTTGWDNTNYSVTAGVCLESFGEPGFDPVDWVSATNQTLDLVNRDRIILMENTLGSPNEVARRKYLLANYLIVKGRFTYLTYFASPNTFDWYPEFDLDLGPARTAPKSVDELAYQGLYRRDFEKGIVLINPTTRAVDVTLEASFKLVKPVGGGPLDGRGRPQGSTTTTPVTTLTLPAKTAEILLR